MLLNNVFPIQGNLGINLSIFLNLQLKLYSIILILLCVQVIFMVILSIHQKLINYIIFILKFTIVSYIISQCITTISILFITFNIFNFSIYRLFCFNYVIIFIRCQYFTPKFYLY